jgi:hypothetical protein
VPVGPVERTSSTTVPVNGAIYLSIGQVQGAAEGQTIGQREGTADQRGPAGSMAAASSPAWRTVKASMIWEKP